MPQLQGSAKELKGAKKRSKFKTVSARPFRIGLFVAIGSSISIVYADTAIKTKSAPYIFTHTDSTPRFKAALVLRKYTSGVATSLRGAACCATMLNQALSSGAFSMRGCFVCGLVGFAGAMGNLLLMHRHAAKMGYPE